MTVTDLRYELTDDRIRAMLAGPGRTMALAEPATLTPLTHAAAGVLYGTRDGRILLVEPNYKPYWDLPGGIVEPGESPRDTARRELHEELGSRALPVGDLLAVDFLPATDARPAGMRYVFGCLWNPPGDGVPFQIDGTEIRSWAWCSHDQQQQRQAHAPILSRRVVAARAALYGGRTVYLENGFEVKA